jgi:hypothetical protein
MIFNIRRTRLALSIRPGPSGYSMRVASGPWHGDLFTILEMTPPSPQSTERQAINKR